MAFQNVNTGAVANDGTGDSPRAAFTKVNSNFALAVEGPTGAVTADTVALFDGTTGKLIKGGGQVNADIVVTSDARLSDARTPLAHGNEAHTSTFVDAAGAAAAAPVQSVNTQTGVVVLAAADVGAYASNNPDGFVSTVISSSQPVDTDVLWVDTGTVFGVGDVVGPATATDGAVALFDGTTGKLLEDGPVPGAANGLATLDDMLRTPYRASPIANGHPLYAFEDFRRQTSSSVDTLLTGQTVVAFESLKPTGAATRGFVNGRWGVLHGMEWTVNRRAIFGRMVASATGDGFYGPAVFYDDNNYVSVNFDAGTLRIQTRKAGVFATTASTITGVGSGRFSLIGVNASFIRESDTTWTVVAYADSGKAVAATVETAAGLTVPDYAYVGSVGTGVLVSFWEARGLE
jgi:hypothetical protein